MSTSFSFHIYIQMIKSFSIKPSLHLWISQLQWNNDWNGQTLKIFTFHFSILKKTHLWFCWLFCRSKEWKSSKKFPVREQRRVRRAKEWRRWRLLQISSQPNVGGWRLVVLVTVRIVGFVLVFDLLKTNMRVMLFLWFKMFLLISENMSIKITLLYIVCQQR